ncbi:MAG: hypothetical protein ABFD50_03030 [Smithella sp.]
MKKLLLNSINAFLLLILFTQTSQADWPLCSKPEFRGKIIDAQTKQPIEGAVALVLYNNEMLIGGPGGPNDYTFPVKETLTDKKGEFYFPSRYSLHIVSKCDYVSFIFYKPGYNESYGGPVNMDAALTEKYFSTGNIGHELEIERGTFEKHNYVKWKGIVGIVELKKGTSTPSAPNGYSSTQLPLLFKALNEERKNRGYQDELK